MAGARPAIAWIGLALAMAVVAAPATAKDAFALRAEIAGIKHDLLRLMRPVREIGPYVYLDLDAKSAPRAATLYLGRGADRVRVEFVPSEAHRRLLRAPLPERARAGTPCRLEIRESAGAPGRSREIPCELPPMGDATMLVLRYRKGWLGPDLTMRRWGADGRPLDVERPGIRGVSGLLDDLLPPAGPRPLAAAADSGRLAPDTRFAAELCAVRPWPGLNRLYARKLRSGHSVMFWWAYAECALRAGVDAEAVAALRRLEARNDAMQAVVAVRLRLAARHRGAGDVEGALTWLDRPPERVPVVLRTRWRDLLSRLYLAQGRHHEAAATLSRGLHLDAAGTWLESFQAASLHYAMRLNYAYALMATRRSDEALAVLERIGTSPALDDASGALRAKANTVLGWQFLSRGFGATAGRAFHRVPLDSHVADRAMLGMGWAMLAPAGEAQPLVTPPGFAAAPTDPPATALEPLRRLGALGCAQYNAVASEAVQTCVPAERFERVGYTGDPAGQRRRALRFWIPLLENSAVGDAVTLEAHIAAARVYTELGDFRRSLTLYRRAIELGDAAVSSLESVRRRLAVPGMLSRLAAGESRIVTAEAPAAVREWLADSGTQSLLASLSATAKLSEQIAAALETRVRGTREGIVLARLRARANAAHAAAAQSLRDSIEPVLERERRRARRYRVQARLQVAELQSGAVSPGGS